MSSSKDTSIKNVPLESLKAEVKEPRAQVPTRKSFIRSFAAAIKSSLIYLVLLLLAINLLFSVLEKLSELADDEAANNGSKLQPQTDDFTKDTLNQIDNEEREPEREKPTIKFTFHAPEGTSPQEYLSDPIYLKLLTIESFQNIGVPKNNLRVPKEGPTIEDIVYINSRLPPVKIVPLWSENIGNGIERFDMRVYINHKKHFNVSNPNNRKVQPNLIAEDIRLNNDHLFKEDLSLTITPKKLAKLASAKDQVYLHIYLYKRKFLLSDNFENYEVANNVMHKIIPFNKQDLLVQDLEGNFYMTPFISLTLVSTDSSGVLQFPKLSKKLQNFIDLDVVNRRDLLSGTISLYYPIIYCNKYASKKVPFIKVNSRSSGKIALEFKVSEKWLYFKWFIWSANKFEQFLQMIEMKYRESLCKYATLLDKALATFITGLVDMINVLYFIL